MSQVGTEEITNAQGIRDKVFSSVQTRKWSKGDFEMYQDALMSPYFWKSALGTEGTATVVAGVGDHTFSRNNSNTPTSLSIISDRVTDRLLFPGVAVDTLTLSVKDQLATLKSALIGQFPASTTSGTQTTASGTVYSFKDSFFAFGSTVIAADAAANLKLSEFQLEIKNNAQPIFRHGNPNPDTVNYGEFEVTADFNLFFENTTDRDAFHNSSKQAACFKLNGNGLASGYREQVKVNFYQVHFETFELETGLANFYAEKAKLFGEYDNANSKTIDVVFRNSKTTAY
jgi:hypothetical protein